MSDLDDLGDIADQMHFGTSRDGLSHKNVGAPPQVPCGSVMHLKPPNIRAYTDAKGRKRYICRLCDKARRRRRPSYSAQGYPL